MKALKALGLLTLVASLTGCGQKYPESYGLYIRNGQEWTPIDSTTPCTVTEKPEFLVFDARLSQSAGKPDVSITLRPMKWIRWNINAFVAQRDAAPRLYEKTRVGSFFPSESSLNMSFSPVKNRRDMLIVTPTTTIPDGYFVLNYFGDTVICRRNVTTNPDELPDNHILDKWSVTHDMNAGFSWDAFLAASQNAGRAVLNEGLEPPEKLATLLETLRQDLASLASDQSTPAMLAFCQRVEKLDSDLYAEARKQCFAVIENEISQAKSNHDMPTAIGIGSMATNAGFISELILKHITDCMHALSSLEATKAEAVSEVMSDKTNTGTKVASFTRNTGMALTKPEVIITDSHINYIAMTWFQPASSWMGEISTISANDDDSVIMVARYPETFRFSNSTDRDHFLSTLTQVWSKWKSKWVDRLTVNVTARPHYWSERVFVYDLPYTLERVSGSNDVLLADVELGANDPQSYGYSDGPRRFDGSDKYYDPRYPLRGQFRVKSMGDHPVTLRIRFCPAIWSENLK